MQVSGDGGAVAIDGCCEKKSAIADGLEKFGTGGHIVPMAAINKSCRKIHSQSTTHSGGVGVPPITLGRFEAVWWRWYKELKGQQRAAELARPSNNNEWGAQQWRCEDTCCSESGFERRLQGQLPSHKWRASSATRRPIGAEGCVTGRGPIAARR